MTASVSFMVGIGKLQVVDYWLMMRSRGCCLLNIWCVVFFALQTEDKEK